MNFKITERNISKCCYYCLAWYSGTVRVFWRVIFSFLIYYIMNINIEESLSLITLAMGGLLTIYECGIVWMLFYKNKPMRLIGYGTFIVNSLIIICIAINSLISISKDYQIQHNYNVTMQPKIDNTSYTMLFIIVLIEIITMANSITCFVWNFKQQTSVIIPYNNDTTIDEFTESLNTVKDEGYELKIIKQHTNEVRVNMHNDGIY